MKRSIIALATLLMFLLPALSVQAGSLSDVEKGMSPEKVKALLGEPDSTNAYPTWKRFVPRFRTWSNDRKRMDWVYKGKGRVVFTYNQYIHEFKVLKVTAESEGGG